jgi:transposase-like protein
MKKQRQKYSAEKKVKILRRHLIDKVPVSDLCDEYGFHPTIFYRWQKAFFENGKAAFDSVDNSLKRKLEDKINKLESRLVSKDEVIASIMADHVKLKKNLGED